MNKIPYYLMLLLGTVQPLVWWLVFVSLQPLALTGQSSDGLVAACVITCFCTMLALIIPAAVKLDKHD